MPTIEERRPWRRLLLESIYDLTDGNPLTRTAEIDLIAPIVQDLGEGVTGPDLEQELNYLQSDGLIDWPSFGEVALTHAGVKEVEEARDAEPDPAVASEITLVLTPRERGEVESVLGELQRAFEAGEIELDNEEERADFHAQLDSFRCVAAIAEAEACSSRPDFMGPSPDRRYSCRCGGKRRLGGAAQAGTALHLAESEPAKFRQRVRSNKLTAWSATSRTAA
jgi:hypothetical protein